MLALVAGGAGLGGCDDGGSSSGGNFTFDGGPEFEGGPGVDGAVVVPDGGTPDAPVVTGGVIVNVLRGGAPIANVKVVAHDATGAVTAELTTDAAGRVTIAAAPSMISVVDLASVEGPGVVTYTDVAAGDVLNVALAYLDPELPAIGSYTMAGPSYDGANVFEIQAGSWCSSFVVAPVPPNVSVSINPYCVGAGATSGAVLVRAESATAMLGYAFAKNLAKPSGGAAVPVTLSAFAPKNDVTLKVTSAPTDANELHSYFVIHDGRRFFVGPSNGDLFEAGLVYPSPAGFGDAVQSSYFVQTYGAGDRPLWRGAFRREAAPTTATATLTHDFTTALAAVTDTVLTPDPASAVRPTVAWTAPGLTGHDGGVVRLHLMPSGNGPIVPWSVVVSPTKTSFKVPALPTGVTLPAGTLVVDAAAFVDATQVASYQQLKALPMPTNDYRMLVADDATPLPATGEVRVTGWGNLYQFD